MSKSVLVGTQHHLDLGIGAVTELGRAVAGHQEVVYLGLEQWACQDRFA